MSQLEPHEVSSDYRNRPELTSWQREILDAFYALARGRQTGFDANPVSLSDMAAMIALNPCLGFYETMDLVDLWQILDGAMLDYWRQKREKDAKSKRQLEEKSSKQIQ